MKPTTFACRVIGAQPVADRVVRLTISTDDVDSFGTRFMPRGAVLDRYLTAPIVLWHHPTESEEPPDPDLAVGRCLRLDVEDHRIVADVEFESDNPVADKILRKLKTGFLFGCSIGALIQQSRPEGSVVVVERWELCEVSLCFVPSNARALIERAMRAGSLPQPVHAHSSLSASRSQRSSAVNPADVLKALGLQEGASYDQVCQALMAFLADTDEKKALVAAVDSMKPAEAGAGADAPGDGAQRTAEPAPADDVERKAMRAALLAKDKQIAELQQKMGPTPESQPTEWAKQMVARGVKGLTEAELAKLAKEDPKVAAKTAELLLPADAKKLPLHSRSLGPAANAGAAGPRLGQSPDAQTATSFAERRKAAEASARR